MRIITQISLFNDTLNENLGDLERLQKVLANLPDEELIQKLKTIRGKGRNEWPVDFEVTKASNSEVKETEKLLENMKGV